MRFERNRLVCGLLTCCTQTRQCNAMQSHYTVVYPYPLQSKSGRNKLQALSILIVKSDAIVIYSTCPILGRRCCTRTTRFKERERLQAGCPPAVPSPHRNSPASLKTESSQIDRVFAFPRYRISLLFFCFFPRKRCNAMLPFVLFFRRRSITYPSQVRIAPGHLSIHMSLSVCLSLSLSLLSLHISIKTFPLRLPSNPPHTHQTSQFSSAVRLIRAA